VIVLRKLSREEAKDEIKDLFKTGRTLYYSDIARELRIDLELVVEICQELVEKGEFEVNDDAVQCR
jgi:Mn-dependent DtxR family transcriptional regulator